MMKRFLWSDVLLGSGRCVALGLCMVSSLGVVSAYAQSAGQDMRNAGHATKDAAKDTAHGVKRGSETAYHKTAHGTTKAYHKTAHGTKKAYHATAHGVEKTGDKVAGKPAPQ